MHPPCAAQISSQLCSPSGSLDPTHQVTSPATAGVHIAVEVTWPGEYVGAGSNGAGVVVGAGGAVTTGAGGAVAGGAVTTGAGGAVAGGAVTTGAAVVATGATVAGGAVAGGAVTTGAAGVATGAAVTAATGAAVAAEDPVPMQPPSIYVDAA